MSHKKKKAEKQHDPDDSLEISIETEEDQERDSQDESADSTLDGNEAPEDPVKALEQEKKDLSDRLLRTMAEFDNYRKRVTREKEGLIKYGTERLACEILPVVDNFERALEQVDPDAVADPVIEGLGMILKQLLAALEKFDIKPFESVEKQFNPEIHEAMAQHEHPDYEDNTVIEQLQKGYMLGERLLRPARVIVSRAPVAEEPENED